MPADPIYKEGFGYTKISEDESEPTDLQIGLLDEVDNEIQNMVDNIAKQYDGAAENAKADTSWDIGKITRIRDLVEELYALPEVY